MNFIASSEKTEYVKIEMTTGDTIVIKLDANVAPLSVANFQKLVSEGFYNGLIFHRVISGFMVQGGDPNGTGMGGSKDTIKGEFTQNGVKNTLSHARGVLSMARSQSPNSASSQFFICHGDAKFLDGQYAAFGYVVAGLDTVDKIAAVATNSGDKPRTEQKMKSVSFVKEA